MCRPSSTGLTRSHTGRWSWRPLQWKNGERLPLTAKELQLFQKLYENAGRIVTTGILCETICGEFWQGYESTLSTHIRHLREKIEENPSKPVSLVTAKGLGYRLNLKGAKS